MLGLFDIAHLGFAVRQCDRKNLVKMDAPQDSSNWGEHDQSSRAKPQLTSSAETLGQAFVMIVVSEIGELCQAALSTGTKTLSICRRQDIPDRRDHGHQACSDYGVRRSIRFIDGHEHSECCDGSSHLGIDTGRESRVGLLSDFC